MADPNILVRGGTSSAANDQKRAKEKAEADQRRAKLDRKLASVKANPTQANVYTHSMGGVDTHACAVLTVKNKDGSILDFIIADVTFEEHGSVADGDRVALENAARSALRSGDAKLAETSLHQLQALATAAEKPALMPILVMVCPSCLHRHRRSVAESHITIRSWHRRFTLDPKRAKEIWVSPRPPFEVYTLAGTIYTHETITCPMCQFRFEIDDGVVREA